MITICRIVVYTLTSEDAEKINRRRTSGSSIAERITTGSWPIGAQAHIGNTAREGQKLPAMVVAVGVAEKPETEDAPINLQVFLDGSDTYWATSVHPDQSKEPKPGTWAWPSR